MEGIARQDSKVRVIEDETPADTGHAVFGDVVVRFHRSEAGFEILAVAVADCSFENVVCLEAARGEFQRRRRLRAQSLSRENKKGVTRME